VIHCSNFFNRNTISSLYCIFNLDFVCSSINNETITIIQLAISGRFFGNYWFNQHTHCFLIYLNSTQFLLYTLQKEQYYLRLQSYKYLILRLLRPLKSLNCVTTNIRYYLNLPTRTGIFYSLTLKLSKH